MIFTAADEPKLGLPHAFTPFPTPLGPSPLRLRQLDNRDPVFGEVIEGIAVVDSIAAATTDSRDNPVQPQRILRVRVGLSETP